MTLITKASKETRPAQDETEYVVQIKRITHATRVILVKANSLKDAERKALAKATQCDFPGGKATHTIRWAKKGLAGLRKAIAQPNQT